MAPGSFETFLATQMGHVNTSIKATMRQRWGTVKLGGAGMFTTHGHVSQAMPYVRLDLQARMLEYAASYAPSLATSSFEGGERHLVIHYRLGDFVGGSYHGVQKKLISLDSVASAAKELAPLVIEIMDGGIRHADGVKAGSNLFRALVNRSQCLHGLLVSKLRDALPLVRFATVPNETSSDADFYRMANAPMLLTATGSFAIAAAVASRGSVVRTPAVDDLFLPTASSAPATLADNWKTYPADVWPVQDLVHEHCRSTGRRVTA